MNKKICICDVQFCPLRSASDRRWSSETGGRWRAEFEQPDIPLYADPLPQYPAPRCQLHLHN